MLPPRKPENESDRLASLHGLNILDTSPEECFDRVTRIAQKYFGVPIALVSLVDEDRQWFKSRQGLDAKETPRDISFCGHAILSPDPLVVRDTFDDDRFRDNPLVTGSPNIRFYGGCPLMLPEGATVGTLCIIDHEPRAFSKDDESVLRDLGGIVERELMSLRMATIDELTQISNRRGFECLSEHALKMCRRLGEPAFLFYLDLDCFKQINDDFGHSEGDLSLQEFAIALTRTFRETDVLGRMGGDEFVVLMTNSSFEGSEAVLRRLNELLVSRELRAERAYDISYSAGVVEIDPLSPWTIADLIAEADKKMYENKRRSTNAAAQK